MIRNRPGSVPSVSNGQPPGVASERSSVRNASEGDGLQSLLTMWHAQCSKLNFSHEWH